jgi:hypothetical protein
VLAGADMSTTLPRSSDEEDAIAEIWRQAAAAAVAFESPCQSRSKIARVSVAGRFSWLSRRICRDM